MNKNLIQLAVAGALFGATALAQAAVVNLSGWAFGNGNHVSVGNPVHAGGAGGFKGSVDFSAAENAAGFADILGNSFITYCVEITESFSLGSGNMTGYAVQSASSYFGALGATTANRLGQLMSYVHGTPGAVDTAAKSTSLQLAIWNVIYDTDNSLNSGLFNEQSAANFETHANSLLSSSAGTTNRYDAYVLSKAGSQDFLLLRELPEPTSLALTFVALAGLGVAAKRRKA